MWMWNFYSVDRPRACPRPGLRALVASWVLKPDSRGVLPGGARPVAGRSRIEGTGRWGWAGCGLRPGKTALCYKPPPRD